MKVLIYAPTLFSAIGGAERFAANLANWLVAHGHEACLARGPQGKLPVYPLAAGAQVVDMAISSADAAGNRKILSDLEPDVFLILSYGRYALPGIISAYGTGVPVVVSERDAPRILAERLGGEVERCAVFAGADIIHLLNTSFAASLPEFLRGRCRVIPNPVSMPTRIAPHANRQKLILAVGRLEEAQKAHSLLIRAFASLALKYPDWQLAICGDGASRALYEELATSLNLGRQLQMPGFLRNLDGIYNAAAIFCMPSRNEGMSNALLEAQAHGLPAVGFADCPGLDSLIKDGENGLLLQKRTPQALARALERLILNEEERGRMASAARQSSLAFASEAVFPQWLELLREAAAMKGRTALNLPPLSHEEQAAATLRVIVSPKKSPAQKQDERAPTLATLRNLRARMLKKGLG